MENTVYIPSTIMGAARIFLESFYIIQNSKSPDIVVGRFEPLLRAAFILKQHCDNPRYLSDIQEAVDSYKTLYYDHTLTELQLAMLSKPNADMYSEIFCVFVYNSFGRQFQEYTEATKRLTRENAKLKRKEKILKMLAYVREEIKVRGVGAKSFTSIMGTIDQVESLINTKTSFDDVTLLHQEQKGFS